jgi:hypothetical protein
MTNFLNRPYKGNLAGLEAAAAASARGVRYIANSDLITIANYYLT